jgi:surface protein
MTSSKLTTIIRECLTFHSVRLFWNCKRKRSTPVDETTAWRLDATHNTTTDKIQKLTVMPRRLHQQDVNTTQKMRMTVTDNLQESYQEWLYHDDSLLVMHVLSFLDVKSLLQKERVDKTWRKLCRKAIYGKCGPNGPIAFQSRRELRDTVKKYCNYDLLAMEEIACFYGYPINKWDVSQVEDMSHVFESMKTFNEPVGSWDVSNVTTMKSMFHGAKEFNQDIGSWNVSNVTDMSRMFVEAYCFNQDKRNWNFSRVTDSNGMFCGAKTFNQDIGTWDVSRVRTMSNMFRLATSFNKNIGLLGCIQRNRYVLHV